MTSTVPKVALSPHDYDAALFDLDGVLTKTAEVHAAAWKRLFDRFLQQRAAATGEAFVPFDIEADYRRYVDGKTREDGVVAFLASRGISLPVGYPEDAPGSQTTHGLGNLKDQFFLQHLKQNGVETYEHAVSLVRALRAHEIKTAVVSSQQLVITFVQRDDGEWTAIIFVEWSRCNRPKRQSALWPWPRSLR